MSRRPTGHKGHRSSNGCWLYRSRRRGFQEQPRRSDCGHPYLPEVRGLGTVQRFAQTNNVGSLPYSGNWIRSGCFRSRSGSSPEPFEPVCLSLRRFLVDDHKVLKPPNSSPELSHRSVPISWGVNTLWLQSGFSTIRGAVVRYNFCGIEVANMLSFNNRKQSRFAPASQWPPIKESGTNIGYETNKKKARA